MTSDAPYIKTFLSSSKSALDLTNAICIITPVRSIQLSIKKNLDNFLKQNKLSPLIKLNYFKEFSELYFSSNIYVLGPICGGPAVRLALEQLQIQGLKHVLLLSVTGAIKDNINNVKIGDVILPTISKCRENPNIEIDVHSALQQDINQEVLNRSTDLTPAQVRSGIIYSTDYPNLESPLNISQVISNNLSAIEMEFYSISELSVQYQSQIAAAFVVSDILGETWERGFSNSIFKTSINILANIVSNHALNTFIDN
jgi:purine-nucleoside phosphorylase